MSGVDELVAFVRARLNEREALLLHTRASGIPCPIPIATLLAEVEAKRRILEEHRADTQPDGSPANECFSCFSYEWPCKTVRLLAQPYAGQNGWREEWRA